MQHNATLRYVRPFVEPPFFISPRTLCRVSSSVVCRTVFKRRRLMASTHSTDISGGTVRCLHELCLPLNARFFPRAGSTREEKYTRRRLVGQNFRPTRQTLLVPTIVISARVVLRCGQVDQQLGHFPSRNEELTSTESRSNRGLASH